MLLVRLKVFGHSMEPTILHKTSVLASSVPYWFSQPKVGDIISFEKEGKLVIKRIKEIENYKVRVVGDNKKDSKDFGWISFDKLIGKVIMKL